jgi:hypothetical protein
MTNPETLAYLGAQKADEEARQRAIVQARKYYRGEHPVYLTDRMLEFIGLEANDKEHPFRLNLVRTVVKALTERLKVSGFDSDEDEQEGPGGAPFKPLARWAWELWQRERMDARAWDVHKMCVRDGEAFIIVAPDDDELRADFYPHQAYTAPECEGDGYGVKVFYTNDDADSSIAYATKHWVEKRIEQDKKGNISTVNVKRMTVYWPGKIERYVWLDGEWKPYRTINKETGEPEPWPKPWLDEAGNPLGVPVICFKNEDHRDEAADAIGLNDAANKALVDLIAAGDLTAFRFFMAFGFYPTYDGQPPATDASNMWRIEPGAVLGTTRPANEAGWQTVDGADLDNLISYVGSLIQWVAMTTDTPLSRFLTTKQVAAEGTLKQQEGPLVAKVEARQVTFGDAWEDCLEMARRIENTFYRANLPVAQLYTTWAPAATRDEGAELDAAVKMQAVGVPQRKIWARLGFSQAEIASMQAMKAEEDAAKLEQETALIQARGPVAFAGNGRGQS